MTRIVPIEGLKARMRGANRNRTGAEFRLGSRFAASLVALVCMFGAVPKKAEPRPAKKTRSASTSSHDFWPGCRTQACNRRVGRRIRKRRRERWAWRQYKRNPMPYCTWAYESGTWGSPWRASRYWAKNPESSAGGKFQIIDRTWYAFGGSYQGRVSHPAAYADPLEQEKIARRVLAGQGIHAWVMC